MDIFPAAMPHKCSDSYLYLYAIPLLHHLIHMNYFIVYKQQQQPQLQMTLSTIKRDWYEMNAIMMVLVLILGGYVQKTGIEIKFTKLKLT